MSKFQSQSGKLKDIRVYGGKITSDKMAQYIMGRYTFKTLKDTREVLYYSPRNNRYRFDGDKLIEQIAEKILSGKNLTGLGTRHYMSEVLGHIQRSTYIFRSKLNSKTRYMNLRNGVLDIKKMELLEHSPRLFSTIKIPVKYDEDAKCPFIDKFLSEIVSKEDIPLMEEIFGWCLDIRSPIQRAILFIGEGSNGKSTFLNLLRKFLGARNCVAIPLQSFSANRFSSSKLFGKLANIYPDLPSTRLSDTSFLKILTGGDAITAEEKFQKSFEFVNRSKLLFSANQPPVIEDEGYAFWRRMIIVNFPNEFSGSKDDKGLLKKLTSAEELSGLLNRAIEGLKRLKKREDFSYEQSWAKTMEKYAHLSDPVKAFVEENCEFDSNKGIAKPVLFQAYQAFCVKKEIPAENNKGFGRIFKRKFKGKIDERANNWTGIYLKQSK